MDAQYLEKKGRAESFHPRSMFPPGGLIADTFPQLQGLINHHRMQRIPLLHTVVSGLIGRSALSLGAKLVPIGTYKVSN